MVDRVLHRQDRFDIRQHYNPAPTADEISAGDIHPFRTLDGTPVGVFLSEMDQGQQVSGRTGSGKSTMMYQVIARCAERGLPAVLMTSKGDGQFDVLSTLFPGRALIAKAGHTVFHNPWYYRWKVLPYFLHIYERHDSSSVLIQIFNLFKNRQQITGAVAPTLSSIIEMIGDVRSPKGLPAISSALKKSLLTVLMSIQSGPLGVSTACQKGWDLVEIVRQGLILIVDTSELGPADEQFLVSSLLVDTRAAVHRIRASQGVDA